MPNNILDTIEDVLCGAIVRIQAYQTENDVGVTNYSNSRWSDIEWCVVDYKS